MGNRTPGISRLTIAAMWLAAAATAICAPRSSLDLHGMWQFRTDAQPDFNTSITVPACWQAQGIGQPSGILRHHYAGVAWYRRTVTVPADWKGRRITLKIGGALRDVELSVNGVPSGRHSGMSAPFAFDVTGAVRPGGDNVFLLRVSIPKGSPETTSPDVQTGAEPTGMLNYIGNWGGLYGNVSLEARPPTWIDDVTVTPDVTRLTARFRVAVRSGEPAPAGAAMLRVSIDRDGGNYEGAAPLEIRPGAPIEREIEVKMPGARLWSPGDPFLYTARITLELKGAGPDRVPERFGMRQIAARGDILLLNGKPLYLRGFGDDNIEVLTGTPPASKETYLHRLRLAKSFGFNAVRFHSMTPPPEYFEAADETGILVMAELPAAYTMYFLPHKDFLRNELISVLRAHRNHPSFVSIAFGNELNPDWIKDESQRKQFFDTIAEFYHLAKTLDPTRIVMSNDGILVRPTDMVSISGVPPGDVPTVRHEFGNYYCSLPDISLIDKFIGVIDPVWLKAKKRWVEQNGLAEQYPAYVANSARLQQIGRKYEIEKVRRDGRVSGYDYWLIVDYPGGTGEGDSWEEGWFDYFWTPKGIRPEEGRELNSAVLPMIGAGLGGRTMWADTGASVGVLVSNYGGEDIQNGTLTWQVTSEGRVLRSSTINGLNLPLGKVSRAGEIEVRNLPDDQARQMELAVELHSGGAVYTNRWNFWSFPRQALLRQAGQPVFSTVKSAAIERLYPFVTHGGHDWNPASLLITSELDRDAIGFVASGGAALLLAGKDSLATEREVSFLPPRGGAIGTMIQDHPALRGFPHGPFCDLQFFNLMEGSGAVSLESLGQGAAPIIGAVRTANGWLSETKDLARVAQLFEVRAGRGRLLATTLRVRENFDEAYPETIYFFDRLLRYALSADFNPRAEISKEQLTKLARQ
jgi:hypothetical protein